MQFVLLYVTTGKQRHSVDASNYYMSTQNTNVMKAKE
jgi:hypothetical protein